jgi:hypothetical protein
MEAIDPRWRKASYSGNGGNCVEVGQARRVVLVRDTTDRSGPALAFSPAAWRLYVAQVKAERSLPPGPNRACRRL